MHHKYRFILFVLCFFAAMLLFTKPIYAEDSNDDYKKEIAQFHYSVMNEGGYIACALDVMENENGTFKLDVVFKENIHGINLGFYTTPTIIQFMEANDLDFDSGFAGSYLYTIGTGTYNSMDELAIAVSQLPFIKMEAEDKGFYAEYDLTVWDDVRKEDNFVDDIYKTNKFLFSYKPIKTMETNATKFEKGIYAWQFKDGETEAIYALQKGNEGIWIIIILGILVFGGGTYLMLFGNPLANRNGGPKRRRNKGYDDYYDDYYYSDDDYY